MMYVASPALINALFRLVTLDHDSVDAYTAGIARLEQPETRKMFHEFRADHARHVHALKRVVRELGAEPPSGVELRPTLRNCAHTIAALRDEIDVLLAFQANENHTVCTYLEALRHPELQPRHATVLHENLDDEMRHRSWLNAELAHAKAG